jgi:hypothetical protein
MLAQSMTETEIANKLEVSQATIASDVKALKEMAQQFVFDMAKSDLAFYYRQCIEGLEQVQRKAWEIFNNYDNKYNNLSSRDQLLALRLCKDCNVEKFNLFDKGPMVLNLKALTERLDKIEGRNLYDKSSKIY